MSVGVYTLQDFYINKDNMNENYCVKIYTDVDFVLIDML